LNGKLQPVVVPGIDTLTPAHTADTAKLIIRNHQKAAENLEKQGSADLIVWPTSEEKAGAPSGESATQTISSGHGNSMLDLLE
jgi:hypothetical protein